MSPVCRLGHLWVHGHRPQEGHLCVLRQGPPAAGGEEGRALGAVRAGEPGQVLHHPEDPDARPPAEGLLRTRCQLIVREWTTGFVILSREKEIAQKTKTKKTFVINRC